MRSKIVGRGISLPAYFEELPKFKTPFSVSDSSDWAVEYDWQLHEPYDEEDPLWRAVYLPNATPQYTDSTYCFQYTIVFGFRHECVDGTSYVRLFNELLDDIETVHNGIETEVESQTLPPSVEEVLDFHLKPTKGAAFFSGVVELIIQLPGMKYLFSAGRLPPNPWIEKYGAEIEKKPDTEPKPDLFQPTFLKQKPVPCSPYVKRTK